MRSKSEITQLIRQQRFAEAKRLCMELCQHNPGDADAWRMMARIAANRGEEAAEIHSLEKIVSISPTRGLAHFNLASCLDKAGRFQQAEHHYRKAIELNYQPARLLSSLGILLHKLGRSGKGIYCCKEALAINRYLVDACTNLGRIYADTAQPELALQQMLRAKDLAPKSYQAHYNLGLAYDALAQTDDAITNFRIALAFKPDFIDARWSLSLTLLRSNQFPEGWELYESRWQRGAKNLQPRAYNQPMWDNSDLHGKHIYLFAEQGYGDTIQFIRYAKLLKSMGAHVICECQPQLKTLLSSVQDIDLLVTSDKTTPPFDTYSPLLSLPRIMGTNSENIPAYTSYLSAPAAVGSELNHLLHTTAKRQKVGIVWAGNPNHANDRNRSCKPEHFSQLASIPNVQLFSLQKGIHGKQLAVGGLDNKIVDLSPLLDDFAITAAVIDRLDLVISVDTAIAHLAGAMGKATWVLLPFSPDWRWLLEGDTSAWYPSMRLFRQPSPGNWQAVLDQVLNEFQINLTGLQLA